MARHRFISRNWKRSCLLHRTSAQNWARLAEKGSAAITQNQAAADRIAAPVEIRFDASIHPALHGFGIETD